MGKSNCESFSISVSTYLKTEQRISCSEVMTISTKSGQDTQGPANAPGSASIPGFMTGFKHTPDRVKK